MTFQARYRFSSRSELPLQFLQICAIIGFIAPWTSFANSTIPTFSQPNQLVQQFQNEYSTTFKNLISLNAEVNNSTNKNNTVKKDVENDEEETTFSPETVLFHLSDRKQFNNSNKKKNNTKFMTKKKVLNATNYNHEPVKALEINSNELPVEKNPQKHPEHKLSKHPTSINLESRMLFDRDEE